MNVRKMIYGVIGLFITLVLLHGGMSETMVLRGTNSSSALVIFALIFLVGDIAYLYSAYREGEVKIQPSVKKESVNSEAKTQTIDNDYDEANVNSVVKNDVVANISTKEDCKFQIGCGKTNVYFSGKYE